MPHDAAAYQDHVYNKTPAQTSEEVNNAVGQQQAKYQSHAKASYLQYAGLTGQVSLVPTLTSLAPNTAVVGGADFTISINGTNFTPYTVILWNGSPEPTTYISPTQVRTLVRPDTIFAPAILPITVRNGPSVSNSLDFTFTATSEDPEPDPDEEPQQTWTKDRIVAWLVVQGVDLSEQALGKLTKAELLDLVADLLDDR